MLDNATLTQQLIERAAVTDHDEAAWDAARLAYHARGANPALTVTDADIAKAMSLATRWHANVVWDIHEWSAQGALRDHAEDSDGPLGASNAWRRRIMMLPVRLYGSATRASRVLLHELTHTTMIALDRMPPLDEPGHVLEEMTAELGAFKMCEALAIDVSLEDVLWYAGGAKLAMAPPELRPAVTACAIEQAEASASVLLGHGSITDAAQRTRRALMNLLEAYIATRTASAS